MLFALVGLTMLHAVELPAGAAPEPVAIPAFPDRLHAFVWLNWGLVPIERMAAVLGTDAAHVLDLGRRMGLSDPPEVTEDQWLRSYITIIRRNWHLLPYDQLLELLDWTPEKLAYALREDDFLYFKLGSLKPKCAPLRYVAPDDATREKEAAIATVVAREFPEGLPGPGEAPFAFVKELSEMPEPAEPDLRVSRFTPRYCSSYFMLYGDPFLETETPAYPDGYLARLAQAGVDGVWLQAVLYKLAPFPWDAALSDRWEERLRNLNELTARAKRHGIGVYLYLNEPRAMPLSFFEGRAELRGVTEGDHAVLCTSAPEVRDYLREAVATVCRAAPDLTGFFTITASENLTNCWSHHRGAECPRCAARGAEVVIPEVNAVILEGIRAAESKARLIAWDWGWPDDKAEAMIRNLPDDVAFMSVSEWSIPISRGGVATTVGEYSLSVIGPGPRATRHWGWARDRGLKCIAKVQAGNTWELSSVPYVPVLENVAQHAANLRAAGVDGLMLGWTLGGCPSPNLEVYAEMGRSDAGDVDRVMRAVAERRFGPAIAPHVVTAWKAFSKAFQEYPYHGGVVYSGPQQMGPANTLWGKSTGYTATMVGFPYDDLDGWRAVYPAEVFIDQFKKVADGFERALDALRQATEALDAVAHHRAALDEELLVAEACAIHFRSVENQARFVHARDTGLPAKDASAIDTLGDVIRSEKALALRLYRLRQRDSRLGFEASNHYFYVPMDLAAKVINCEDLLHNWLP
ncbi:MAG TPA: hypothetical protein PKI11_14825 [Candidatus Hydrogenedentes bacterium]|nr:hypothetical protein [Candidatus Hydrogenedentota bacterium]HNT87076.1 hypothetical protein [Candidatus Hydrogenedentota bacterium]